jgi:hypothetical protein
MPFALEAMIQTAVTPNVTLIDPHLRKPPACQSLRCERNVTLRLANVTFDPTIARRTSHLLRP